MSLKDRKIIVTGGPTREWIDPVRFISNPSSGKMGVALAEALTPLSRETVFIHGPIASSLVQGKPFRAREIGTTVELLNAVMEEMEDRAVLVMAAAPADYRPREKSPVKIKKSGQELHLALVKNPDILLDVAGRRSRGELKEIFVVGFAAETTDTENYARDKLAKKNLDMICLNDVTAGGAGFGGDTNIITIFTRSGERTDLSLQSKDAIAGKIAAMIDRSV